MNAAIGTNEFFSSVDASGDAGVNVDCSDCSTVDFLSDSEKMSSKIGWYSNKQKLTHCSESNSKSEFESYFLSDVNGFQSHFIRSDIFRIGQFLGLGHCSL